jgi:adenosylcobinamide-GDP ribazoletransferase
MRSLIIAFAMYSKIPMPRVSWDDKGMRYAMCFFPAVGAVLGALSAFLFWLLDALQAPDLMLAALLAALPLVYTGGIHMDGFMDTQDAVHSYADREKRLQILKDSHIGAFAVIGALAYMTLSVGLFSAANEVTMPVIAASYAYSRILSAIAVTAFPKAKKDGMLRTFSDRASDRVFPILIAELATFAAALLALSGIYGAAILIAGALVFAWYHHMAVKMFGGTTGDLAGYFVCLAELWMLAAVVFLDLILRSVL